MDGAGNPPADQNPDGPPINPLLGSTVSGMTDLAAMLWTWFLAYKAAGFTDDYALRLTQTNLVCLMGRVYL